MHQHIFDYSFFLNTDSLNVTINFFSLSTPDNQKRKLHFSEIFSNILNENQFGKVTRALQIKFTIARMIFSRQAQRRPRRMEHPAGESIFFTSRRRREEEKIVLKKINK